MTDPPFGFGPPRDRGGSGDDPGGSPDPMGPLGDPQQFADALRQFADLMSWQSGPVNWDLAKNVARQTVAAKGDPSVLDIERQKVTDAIRVADLWLEDVTSFPTGIRAVQAWSRSEWVEATLPVWSKLCDPIAARAVDAMGGLLAEDPDELGGELPPELRSAMTAMTGGMGGLGALGGLGQMMRRIGGMMVGGQTGAAIGALAREVVSSTDVGLPLGPEGTAALLPAGVADFGEGLSVDPDEVRLFLAMREAAHHRLFAHVPWLRSRLLGAVEDYARGITVDTSALREAMPQIDPANPEALNEALAGAALFQPEDSEQQKAAPGHRRACRADLRDAGRTGAQAAQAQGGRGHLAGPHRGPRRAGQGRHLGASRPAAHRGGLRRSGRFRDRKARAGHLGPGPGHAGRLRGPRRRPVR